MHDIIQELSQGLSQKCLHYVHHVGGNKPSLHFIWRLENVSEGELINRCTQIIRKIEVEAPVYERCITKKNFMHAFGFVGNCVALIAIFRGLSGDHSAGTNLSESKIDK